jgi:3-oxoacyl-(acyl-carrier-protein) synthase
MRVFVSGLGVVSCAGSGVGPQLDALRNGVSRLAPVSLFPVAGDKRLLVGQAPSPADNGMPRTHALALQAAQEAMTGAAGSPDAVVIGSTTGGIFTTEDLLRRGEKDPACYRFHDVGTVADVVAARFGCTGPALTVSTACSSSALAIKIAMELLRTGRARRVLAGGADSLSRLTYYGFAALQLIDPAGCRPLDRDRQGMNVAEGAAVLRLESNPANALAEICGGGLTCDAYHATSPDPDGKGALAAMVAALADAGVNADEIDYINLHGTGTANNDLAEARAIRALFRKPPLLSSTKGIFGHTLGAAGALEAAICVLAVDRNLAPPNVGFANPDPDIALTPLLAPESRPVRTALSNSLGFGGNNASLVFRKPDPTAPDGRNFADTMPYRNPLAILGSACLTAKGELADTIAALARGEDCRGKWPLDRIAGDLPPRFIRRLERLPLMALNLANRAVQASGGANPPQAVFFGTGHGPLSETNNFLRKLFDSDERFASAIDFAGSVHNAPASQAAIFLKATGANVTASGGDYSFEQALLAAELLADPAGQALLALGADEGHEDLSALFDVSVHNGMMLSDGGGALALSSRVGADAPTIRVSFLQTADGNPHVISSLVAALNGAGDFNDRCATIFVGLPLATRIVGERQLAEFLAATRYTGPVFDYRRRLGEYPTVTATAAALAAQFAKDGGLPGFLNNGKDCPLDKRTIAIIGLGRVVSCIELNPPSGQ